MDAAPLRTSLDLDALEGMEFPWRTLGLGGHGVSFARLEPGQGYPFWHRHREQVDVYIGLEGDAVVVVDDREHSLGRGDFLAVPPGAARILGNRGPEPCLVLIAAARPAAPGEALDTHLLAGDGESIEDRPLPSWDPAPAATTPTGPGGPEDL